MYFEFGLESSFTDTTTRAVGPRLASGQRGTVPTPANRIFVDGIGGNDANPGTAFSPVQTLQAAIALFIPGTNAIQLTSLFSTGLKTALFSGSVTLPTNCEVYVPDGFYGAIMPTANSATLTIGDGVTINGIAFENAGFSTTTMFLSSSTTICDIENCFFTGWQIQGAANPKCNFSYCSWGAPGAGNEYSSFGLSMATADINYINCLIQASTNSLLNGSTRERNFHTQGNALGETAALVNFTRCTLINLLSPIKQANTTLAGSASAQFDSCVVENCTSVGRAQYDGNANQSLSITTNFSKVGPLGVAVAQDTLTGVTATNGGTLAITNNSRLPGLPSMWINPGYQDDIIETTTANNLLAGLESEVEAYCDGSQLQKIGRLTTGGGRYEIDSPLVGAGIAAVDANPWDDSATFVAYSFAKNVTVLNAPPKGFSSPRELANPRNATNLDGDLQKAHDGQRRRFTIEYGQGTQIGNDNLWKLERILQDTGSIRFFRTGASHNEYLNATTGALTGSSFAPASPSEPLIIDHWAGYWIRFDSKDFLITSNTAAAWTLEDSLGVGFPVDASYSFTIPYILVKSPQATIGARSSVYSQNTQGVSQSEIGNAQTVANQYEMDNLELVEVRSLDENES